MRKSLMSVVVALAVTGAGAVQAQDYRQAARDAQRQAWQNAGMGVAINAGSMLIGGVVSRILQPQGYAQGYGAPAQGYAAPGYGGPPPVVNPYYYPQAQACVTQQAPVFDSYGRVVEFVQYCANPAR